MVHWVLNFGFELGEFSLPFSKCLRCLWDLTRYKSCLLAVLFNKTTPTKKKGEKDGIDGVGIPMSAFLLGSSASPYFLFSVFSLCLSICPSLFHCFLFVAEVDGTEWLF